ncbi:unnamed protein product [Cyclocybe aegerita]|uniref:Probable RNA polymerase II nuclear localization protein SLC7A6OS n=1 Tax=Cyclocybe aegerita TaxID=1973307 RepID=A0A8S0WGE0_CYCAE|nr:unnamed protein product [Cyclocybe aegerita]
MQVDSMNITPDPTSSSQPYTILRIKRKRNEEPLDALVVESMRRKKSKGGIGVFQYAQTVEDDVWDNAQRQQDVQDKISRLARESAVKAEWKAPAAPVSEVAPSPATQTTRRYTIVESGEPEAATTRYPTAPPRVIPVKELEEQAACSRDFKMFDAVPTQGVPVVQDELSEVDKFLPMLNDYLKIHEMDTEKDSSVEPLKKPSSQRNATLPLTDDYVWDVFYHRPVTLSEWNEAAKVGTLTGLPASFDGYDSLSDSDEEVDEADEDSNAEEYYKNDYPDEEDDSDEWHEDSEYEGLRARNDSDSDL